MATANQLPPQPGVQPPAQAAVNTANNIVEQHPWMATQAPEITSDLISGNADPATVDALDHTSRANAVGNAIVQHQNLYNTHSIWADALGGVANLATNVIHGIGHIVPGFSTVASWANKPLQEMQKDFKFIGAIYKDRGLGEGLLATAGVVAGGVLGSAIGPEGTAFGATLGADLAGMTERQVLGRVIPDWKKPFTQSSDPTFIMNPGQVVADVLSKVPGLKSLSDTQHGWGQTVSGLTDMGFDFTVDPVVGVGKLASALKRGEFLKGVATADGKQVGVVVNSKLANVSDAFTNFIFKNSGVQYSSEGVQMVLEQGKGIANAGLLGKLGNTFNPFTATARNFYRAAQTIADETNPVAIQALFPGSDFSFSVAKKLAKANTPEKVASVIGDSLYLREMNSKGDLAGMANRLVLPTQTLARSWYGKGIDNLLQKAGDPTLDQTKNLIVPKKVAVKDENGNFLDVNGGITKDTGAEQAYMRMPGGLYSKEADGTYSAWNALAGKVRTFTGYRALNLNRTLMEQSAKVLDIDSPDLGVTIYNMARYAMGRDAALEAAANVMKYAKTNDAAFNTAYGNLVKEVAKAAGVSEDANVVRNVMSQAQRAHVAGHNELKAYGQTVGGNVTPATEMVDKIDSKGNVIPQDPAMVALHEKQIGGAGIIDFKQLRQAVKEANAYNRIYSKADDFFTWYTERAFAPLTLFTTGFGIRVAAGEAMHEVMRNGLGNYLKNIVAANARRYDKDLMTSPDMVAAVIKHRANAVADGATAEDLKALSEGGKGIVKENEMTKYLSDKEGLWDKLGLPRPIGYVSRKMAPYVAADKLDVINRYQQMSGVILPSSMTATHLAKLSTAAEDEVNTLAQLMRKPVKAGQDPLALFDYTHPQYHGHWAVNLNNWADSVFGKDIAADYMRLNQNSRFAKMSMDAKWLKVQQLHEQRLIDMPKRYEDLKNRMIGLNSGKPASFAANQVQSVRGLVEGADGTTHTDLIQNIADGKHITADVLREKPIDQSITKIIGRVRPDTTNMFNKIIEAGHRNVIGPIIDHISREPIFNHYLYENYRAYKPALDAGLLSEDEALRLSGQAAVANIIPLVHNPALRSQIAMLHRNFAPFYFAQEQAMKRAGRLVLTNPAAFRDFQMIQQGMNNPGFVHTDASGQQYIVYPILGHFGQAVARGLDALGISQYTGLPVSVTGSTQSLLSVLPETKMPSVNPFANTAVSQLANLFPNFMGLGKVADRVANLATGASPFDPNSSGHMSTNFLDTMIPNSSIRDFFNALVPNQRESMVHNAMLSAIAAAATSGQLDKEHYAQMTPAEQQAVLDRIQHNAQTNLMVKGLLAFFLPLSPNVTNDYYTKNLQTFRSEFLQMTLPKAQGGLGMTLPEATAKFMEEHGKEGLDASSYTVSRTVSGSGGSSMPLSDSVLGWLASHKDLLQSHPYASAYLVPQTAATADALKVEKTLLAMHLRETRTPQDFLSAVYVTKGWAELQPSLLDYQAQLAAAQKAGNRIEIANLHAQWKQFTTTYGASNPIWYADYQNPTKATHAQYALSQLKDLSAKGQLGNSNVVPGIKELLASYEDYHAQLAANMYDNNQRRTPGYAQVVTQWNDYLNALALKSPELANVISGVFKRVV
jgi:hypothetical protein